MIGDRTPLARFQFTARIIEWRGPAPFLFAPIPEDHTGDVLFAARSVSYGWGGVPVSVRIRATQFTTSLFPRGGAFLLPIKLAVQRTESIGLGAEITASVTIAVP